MRDPVPWASAVLFLLAALFTVTVRREVYAEARRIGAVERELREQRRQNGNAAIRRESLASPGALLERARAMGLLPDEESRPAARARGEAPAAPTSGSPTAPGRAGAGRPAAPGRTATSGRPAAAVRPGTTQERGAGGARAR